ncbi:MAG: hypothetical protein MJA29_00180 [Candidatus Omnitrophica bacterium]|nr:hypothetical protein [Candidatus Omnitrophota bacterium]
MNEKRRFYFSLDDRTKACPMFGAKTVGLSALKHTLLIAHSTIEIISDKERFPY